MPYTDKTTARNYAREYYHKNKDAIRNRQAKRAEKKKEYDREYSKNHKDQIAAYGAAWYQKNKAKAMERTAARFKEHSGLIANIKSQYGCMNAQCSWSGSKNAVVFDFHHIDGESKTGKISQMQGRSKNKIREEINKCIVLCANCHRLLHAGESIDMSKHCNVDENLKIIT